MKWKIYNRLIKQKKLRKFYFIIKIQFYQRKHNAMINLNKLKNSFD